MTTPAIEPRAVARRKVATDSPSSLAVARAVSSNPAEKAWAIAASVAGHAQPGAGAGAGSLTRAARRGRNSRVLRRPSSGCRRRVGSGAPAPSAIPCRTTLCSSAGLPLQGLGPRHIAAARSTPSASPLARSGSSRGDPEMPDGRDGGDRHQADDHGQQQAHARIGAVARVEGGHAFIPTGQGRSSTMNAGTSPTPAWNTVTGQAAPSLRPRGGTSSTPIGAIQKA